MAFNVKKKLNRLEKERIVQHDRQRIDRLKTWYFLLATPAAIVAVVYIDAYAKHTFIGVKDLLLIGLVSGSIFSLPCLKVLKGYTLLLIAFLGGVFVSLFLLINQCYAGDKVFEIVKKPVVEKWHWAKHSHSRVDVLYEDVTATFYVEEKSLEHSNYVTLTIKKGCFGYAFIDDYKISAQ